MYRVPRFWGIHAEPTHRIRWFLGALPFIIIVSIYSYASYQRFLENPRDKLMPTPVKMVEAAKNLVHSLNLRTDEWEYPFLIDNAHTLTRVTVGVICAASVGLLLGMNMAIFAGMEA